MESDFFTEDYGEKKRIEEITVRLAALTDELHGGYEQTGRSAKFVEEEIERLTQERDDLLLTIEHDEDAQK